jgi:hypothetical protein
VGRTRSTPRWAPLVLGIFFSLWQAWSQDFRGRLTGAINDAFGGRIASASIVIRSAESGVERRATSGPEGEFRVDNLLPGSYLVVVTAAGFAEARADVNVLVGSLRELTVTLQPASVQQTLTVQGRASSIATEPIDAWSAVDQGIVTRQDLETIPLAARSFANIAYLAPGTEPVEPSDPTKARITAVSTGGSSGLNNELSVDGADNSDDWIGGFLQNFSPDAIQEFAMRTSQEDADTGRTTAGSVVITTRRGTDDWHGDAAFYERDASLNARFPIDNPAPNPKQPFSRQNYVGALGGPMAKSKFWFFSAFEFVHEDASIAYSPPSLSEFNALSSLEQAGLLPGVGPIAVPSQVPVPFRDFLGMARFDWTQSSRSQWFLRTAVDTYTTHNALVQQGTLPSTGAESHNNYLGLVLSNQFDFSPTWIGSFVFGSSGLHLTQTRNSDFGFALAFPFSTTSSTISGFETFGDNQFVTPITLFPVLRNQEKYQFRYDVSHSTGRHGPRFGINFIHEPVLGGALANPESIIQYPADPNFYLAHPSQFYFSATCDPPPDPVQNPGITCTPGPGGLGFFAQNVQRLGLYAEDSWRVGSRLTLNYGLRYDTTFGLFDASGRSQAQNPALLTLQALEIPLVNAAPHDYRHAFGPRIGVAYAPGGSLNTVLRAGFGLFFDDLAQNGWAPAFQAVAQPGGACTFANGALVGAGCLPGADAGGAGALIDPRYHTPYAIHATAGAQHAFNSRWLISADYVHEQGVHGYRGYSFTAGDNLSTPLALPPNEDQGAVVPDISVFRSDNRSSYNALMVRLQGNPSRRLSFTAHYTLSKAETWGCVLGELFDYVNGVCDPLNAFARGDYGPSGEDVRHRFVVAGTLRLPGGFELTTLSQAESARPFTITTADGSERIAVHGVPTSLDEFRGTPYIQVDLRVSRPIRFRERWTAAPFIEFFNLFNRDNPGANYTTDIAALPVPPAQAASGNVTDVCLDPACTSTSPITSLKQLRVPAGGLGDFFGPGTTVGIPFAAQIGARVSF